MLSAVVVALAVSVLWLAGGHGRADGSVAPGQLMHQLIYTAPTANDAAVQLPLAVKSDLRTVGLSHGVMALTRVESNGEVATSMVDLTPRAGGADGHVLKVAERASAAIDATIAEIEAQINGTPASSGGRALYSGMTRITFAGVPVTLVSTGLDLSDPDDFRKLNWTIPPEQLVHSLQDGGIQPALNGPVTFAIVPTVGAQPQLGRAQKDYRQSVWTAVLTAAGATSVRFLDAPGSVAASTVSAPFVPVPDLPDTPIAPEPSPIDPQTLSCALPSSYFVVNSSLLIDPERTARDLEPCIQDAVASGATFALDGWTSYEGPLDAAGKPVKDDADNRKLSERRVRTIADLLVGDLGVPRESINRLSGHGNVDQPDPDPRSPANRVVVVSYTIG